MSPAADSEGGWTLPELVTVIAVLAVVAAIAAPRSFDRDLFAARGYAVELAAAARLARAIAIGSACPVRLIVDGSGYRARQPAVAGTHCASGAGGFVRAVPRSDGGTVQGTRPANVPFSGVLQWTFNGDGTVQIAGGAAAVIAAHTVSIDPASGRISGP